MKIHLISYSGKRRILGESREGTGPDTIHLMKPFDYVAAATLDEALGALAGNREARVLAGGTDLLVQMKGGRREPAVVVDVKRIPELM